jgi:ADP-heptose:LPS heptosyltransferase
MIGLPIEPDRAFSDSLKQPLLYQEFIKKRKKGIILHPGSGSEKKNYPPGLWFELINGLKAVVKGETEELILLLGPSEEEVLPLFSSVLDESAGRLIFGPEKKELLSLLGRASLYIGHDSGITHLAAMLGTPVIALFRDSSVEQWAPLGPNVRIMKLERGERDFIERIIEEGVKYI